MKAKFITIIAMCFVLVSYAQEQARTRVSIEIGYGYRISETPNLSFPEVRDHIKKLRQGFNIDTHLDFFVKPHWGLGITYSRFRAKAYSTFTIPVDGVTKTSDDIRINYIAPEVVFRSISENKKHSFILTSSLGYLSYVDYATLNRIGQEIRGAAIGLGLGLMYDYHITSAIAVGVGANFITGAFFLRQK